MRKKFERLFPLGLDITGQMTIVIGLLTVEFLIGHITFLSNFRDDVLENCYRLVPEMYILKDVYQMPAFLPMLRNCFGIGWYTLALLGLVAYNYRYHYRGSKSIYLMRRIENVWEMHGRCWGIVVVGILGAILCMLLLGIVCYWYYCTCELPEINDDYLDWF